MSPGTPHEHPVTPSATTSIVVEDVCKTFTLQYHRTLKQMAVATARRLPLSETFQARREASPSSRASPSA